jgi:enterochelin esterase family protein
MRWCWLLVVAGVVGCGAPGQGLDDAGQDGGLDAGTDAGTAEDCTRAGQTKTAPLALLDALRADLAQASTPAERAALTDGFFARVAEAGGTPLASADGQRVAFVARDAPQTGYSVGGDFNGWTPGVDVLTRVGDSAVWALEKDLPRTQAYQYKMIDGSVWYEDRRARHVVWDGLDRNGPGEFNALVHPGLWDAGKGRLVAWRGVRSEALNDYRDVFVYVPAVYDHASCPRLPSLYFHDGNESLTRAPFTGPADSTYAAHPDEAALLVFVALPDQSVRMKQYTFGGDNQGDTYLAFLADALRPQVEQALRTCPRAVDRGLSGASLGGLMSGYGAFQNPGVWGYVGSQSGSYFWESDAMLELVKSQAQKPLRWYLDHGCPGDNCDVNRRLKTELEAKGYPLRHVEQAEAKHEWTYWRDRLPGLLRYFREGRQGCAP